jgi:hypothetical protein
MWDDVGVVYEVLSMYRNPFSTGVHLELVYPDDMIVSRTVPDNQIEWIEDED